MDKLSCRSIARLATVGAVAFSSLARAADGGAAADTTPTVAVLYFDYSGKDNQMEVLRKGLAQMIISDLSPLAGLRLVERARIEEVLAELKLQHSANADPASASRLGKLLGARFLVLGSYFDLMGALRVDARVVEVETGRVVSSYGVNGKPDDFLGVEQKLSEEISRVLRNGLPPLAARAPSRHPVVKPPSQLKTRTALHYASALDALDRGDKAKAKGELETVVKEQPDFKLASLDLARLIQ